MTGESEVSVVIPTYQRRRCLGRALDAVLSQDHAPLEVIVVDDASPDGTADWAAAAYPQVRLIRAAVNRGVSAARNSGLAAARGTFIAFLDDDDWWDKAFLSRQLARLASRPDAVLSYCDFTSVAEDGGSPAPRVSRGLGADPVPSFLLGNPIASLTLAVMRLEAVRRAGGFREDYRNCEDREFYLRLLPLGAFVREPRALAYKTRSADGATVNMRAWEKWAQTLLDDFFAQERSRPYRALEGRARAVWQARLALGCFQQAGRRLLGLRLLASAARFDAGSAARYVASRVAGRLGFE